MLKRLPPVLALLLLAGPALAQSVEPYEEFGKRLRAAQEVTPLRNDAFGDAVSLYNGETTFTNVDISIPAGTQLPVELRRTLKVEERKLGSGDNVRGFAEWDVDVPYVTGTFTYELGWKMDTPNGYDRCSSPGVPDTDVSLHVNQGAANNIWAGYYMHVPGAGDQELLVDNADSMPDMADGNAHPWITTGLFRIGCLPTLKNNITPGEGFVAVSPQGVRYYFDWVIERPAPPVYMSSYNVPEGTYFCIYCGGQVKYYANRKHVMILATRVEDRFGHGVNYTYTADKLTRIQADDGRYIDLVYSSDGKRIEKASSTVGTWTYTYQKRLPVVDQDGYTVHAGSVDVDKYALATVSQPDTSKWSYGYTGSLQSKHNGEEPVAFRASNCQGQQEPFPKLGTFGLSVTAPWGATASYAFTYRRHFRNYVPLSCLDGNPKHKWPLVYAFFDNFTLESKQVTGPGLDPANWTYDYGGVNSWYYTSPDPGPWDSTAAVYIPPASTSPVFETSKNVTVTGPTETTVYAFGVQYARNEGRLLSTTVKEPTGTVRRVTTNTYVPEEVVSTQPFPTNAGRSLNLGFKSPMAARLRPISKVEITQDSLNPLVPNFATKNNSFDVFGTPTSVTRSGVGTNSTCTEVTSFEHNLASWVIGLEKTRSGCDMPKQADYHPTLALPTRRSNGGVVSTFDYFTDNDTDGLNGNDHQVGDLKAVTDGNSQTTSLKDYYLGIPRRVEFPTGSSESATVNTKGQVTSVTDENGYATAYGYDAMGRVNLITPPSEVSASWSPTSITFTPMPSTAEWGVPAGHWKRVVAKGNYRNVTVYDGMWRPVVNGEWDANVAGTERYTRFAHDAEGRTTFESYKGAINALTTGVRTSYDALGRVLTSTMDSELGKLTTTTYYLPGFARRVTNPRKFSTHTTFWARGEPSTDYPEVIRSPFDENMGATAELQTTTILRGVLPGPSPSPGLTTSIRRQGSWGGSTIGATRYYAYDPNYQLCRISEPESGSTVLDYDGAGNIAWTAAGQLPWSPGAGEPEPLQCHRTDIASSDKSLRTYDAVNRIKKIDVANTTNDPTYEYFPDGALKKLTNGPAVWDYTYNKLRLPVNETLSYSTKVRTLAHGYNALGHENSLTYPSGLFVASLPNALGNATQAGAYATGVTYHPNGGMAGFNYLNGIVHSMVQNERKLPDRSVDQQPGQAAVLDDSYDYDYNGNVAAITDAVVGGGGNRAMTYDGLDRLTNTDAPNWVWLNAKTTYDPLDNIRSNKVGSRTYNYTYDSSNTKLLALVNAATGATARTITTDARGNITGNGTQVLTFDYANRMTGAAGKESYAYDGHGRRVWINRVSDNKASFPMYSLGGQLIAEDDYRSNLTTDYVYLNGSLVFKRSAAIGTTAWVPRYIHTDALGSPVAESDQASPVPVVRRIEKYSPYGEPNDNGYDQGPGFTGHVTDAATGYSYMQQRYYDPVIGRFLSIDPVAAGLQDGRGFNRYNYANNNPYRFVDPDGRQSCPGNASGNCDPNADDDDKDECGFFCSLGKLWDGLVHEYNKSENSGDTGAGRIVDDGKGGQRHVYREEPPTEESTGDKDWEMGEHGKQDIVRGFFRQTEETATDVEGYVEHQAVENGVDRATGSINKAAPAARDIYNHRDQLEKAKDELSRDDQN
jgi:RHS repeat-associated protein